MVSKIHTHKNACQDTLYFQRNQGKANTNVKKRNSNIRREQNRVAPEIALHVRITGSYETWLAQVPEPIGATEKA
jgi:hypothetical protein